MLLDNSNAVIDLPGGRGSLPGPRFVRASSEAAMLRAENDRLHAELHARAEELRETRARAVAAADAERHRLERDLHDGAQNRLLAIMLDLRRAQARAEAGSEVSEMIDTAIADLAAGIDELRTLSRGRHPAVLSERGLDAALDALAIRAPLPVEVSGAVGGRVSADAEVAAYFVVSEALANVAKHARASHAAVAVSCAGGRLAVEVADDGRGGAAAGGGSGLRGLADRVGALGGRLVVESRPGCGTRVRAEVPCGEVA